MDNPGPLGIVMGTNFAPLAFALAVLLVVVDVLIYYPFLKVYDEQILAEEQSGKVENSLKEKVATNFNTAKADAILEKAQSIPKFLNKQTFWYFVQAEVQVDCLPML